MIFRLKGRRLPTLTFRYVNETFQGNLVARPKVEIRLSNGDKSLKIAMLVDSGADISFLPLEVAEILDLKLSDKKKSRSASGLFETALSTVNAELIKGTQRIPLGLMDVRIPTKKTDDQSGNPDTFALLGRKEFFRKFDITFRETTHRLILRPPKKR
jgi:hypothetical protein